MSEQQVTAGTLTLGEGVTISGKINAAGRVQVFGTVKGEIEADDIAVGKTGRVEGSLSARNVDIRGEVGETIVAREQIVIRSTAVVTGTVTYQTIQIEGGARIDGHLRRSDSAAPPPAPAPAVEPGDADQGAV
ncbi:MAG: polymer-forming cytoskeletal protein [Rubrivivax sp.]